MHMTRTDRDYDNSGSIRMFATSRWKRKSPPIFRRGEGERFSVVNAASTPVASIRPNRVQMVLGGLFGGLASGLALAVISEFLAGPIHGEGATTRLMGIPLLAVLPVLRTDLTATMFDRVRRIILRRPRQSPTRRSGAK